MARSDHSRSRSPGPWHGRGRGGGAMARVGPPPPRARGNVSSRSSRGAAPWCEHYDQEGEDSRKRKALGDEVVYGDGGRRHGGNAQEPRGSNRSSWQIPHGSSGRMNTSREDGGGAGEGASRREPSAAEGRGRRMHSSSGTRRQPRRGSSATRQSGLLAAGKKRASVGPTFHGYPDDAATYEKRDAAWSRRGETYMHAAAAGDQMHEASGGDVGAAADYHDGAAARAVLLRQEEGWRGDRQLHAQEAEGNSSSYTYSQDRGVYFSGEAPQQQFAGSNGGWRTKRAPGSTAFVGSAAPREAGHEAAGPMRGGARAATAITAGSGEIGEDDEDRLLQRPLLNFKQFVLMKPDDCTQKELSRAYEAYIERHNKFHAEQFFEKYGGDAFMRELYHPNLIRRQHELRKGRAKVLAQAFLQKVRDGFFNGMALEADSREIHRFYAEAYGAPRFSRQSLRSSSVLPYERVGHSRPPSSYSAGVQKDSPLLLTQWPTTYTVCRRFCKKAAAEEVECEVVDVEDALQDEELGEKRDILEKEEKEADQRKMNKHGSRRRRSAGEAFSFPRRRRSGAEPGGDGAGGARPTSSSSTEEEEEDKKGDAGADDPLNRCWPPYVQLPSPAECLVIRAVDPSISKLEILDELASKEVVDVAMILEGDVATDPRTAFVFFSSSEAKQHYKQTCPDLTMKLTKPVVTIGEDGEEQETLRVFSLSLCELSTPSSCEALITPPAACTPARMRKDLETSAALILALDRQLEIFEEEDAEEIEQHPLLSSFPENWSTQRRLDLQITYLRQVHALCYYSGELCHDVVDVNLRCKNAYLRPRLPAASQQAMYLQLQQQQGASAFVEGRAEEMSSEEESVALSDRGLRERGTQIRSGGRARRSRNLSGLGKSNSNNGGVEEEEHQEEMEAEDDDHGEEAAAKANRRKELCMARPQRQWLRQLDEKLQLLLKEVEKMQDNLPGPLEETTPIISLRWNAFCQEKVFEDDEHKHRCRLCHKPFKAPHFVFKHLRKKHEEELNFIIERYASIVMKEAYMRDPRRPTMQLALKGELSSSNSSGSQCEAPAPSGVENTVNASSYGWGYPPTPAPPPAAPPAGTPEAAAAAAGWPPPSSMPAGVMAPGAPPVVAPGVAPPPPYGVFVLPDSNIPPPGAHPSVYTLVPSGAGVSSVLSHPVPPLSSQSFAYGGAAILPPQAVYGGASTHFGAPSIATPSQSRDWDAPERVAPVIVSAGGAARQVSGSRRLASYADL